MQRLDRHFRTLTRASFERYGFAFADLLRLWPEIAGPDVSEICEPVRIRWPGKASADKQNGVLHVKCAFGGALDLHHRAPQLIDRINGFYGYQAVASLKIVQGALSPEKPPQQRPSIELDEEQLSVIGTIDNPDLKNALTRLAIGIKRDAG